jgi:FixJ family two-component response regulator
MSDNFPLVAIIDDDVAARRALARLLAAHRYRVLQYGSAESYLKAVDGKDVVCAVIDINLGEGMSGLDLGREIKASARPIPLIFMSGYADNPVKVQAWEIGCIDFFDKPCQSSELLAAIHAARFRN